MTINSAVDGVTVMWCDAFDSLALRATRLYPEAENTLWVGKLHPEALGAPLDSCRSHEVVVEACSIYDWRLDGTSRG
jgi:hypothetical protein